MSTYSDCVEASFGYGLRVAAFTSVTFGVLGYAIGYYAGYHLTHNSDENKLRECGRYLGKIFGIAGLIAGGVVGFNVGFESSMFVTTALNADKIVGDTVQSLAAIRNNGNADPKDIGNVIGAMDYMRRIFG